MQNVTVLVVFGVELWLVMLQSETLVLSTALLKVDLTMCVMSSAITVCATHDIVVVCLWMQSFIV